MCAFVEGAAELEGVLTMECSPRILVDQLVNQFASKLGLSYTAFDVEGDRSVCGLDLVRT